MTMVTKLKLNGSSKSAIGSAASEYIKELRSLKRDLLTRKQEVALAKRIEKGDKEAKRQFIEANLRLVIPIAKKLLHRGLDFEDLVAAGNLGLIAAVEKFSWRRGTRFSTFACWWIKHAIFRALERHGRTIRLPNHTLEDLKHLNYVRSLLLERLGREPSLAELSTALNMDEAKVRKLLALAPEPLSIDYWSPAEGEEESDGGFWFQDTVLASEDPTPEETVLGELETESVRAMLESLTPREREVLTLRFGFEDHGQPSSLDHVADLVGISRERVRQIESRALEKLRQRFPNPSLNGNGNGSHAPLRPRFTKPAPDTIPQALTADTTSS